METGRATEKIYAAWRPGPRRMPPRCLEFPAGRSEPLSPPVWALSSHRQERSPGTDLSQALFPVHWPWLHASVHPRPLERGLTFQVCSPTPAGQPSCCTDFGSPGPLRPLHPQEQLKKGSGCRAGHQAPYHGQAGSWKQSQVPDSPADRDSWGTCLSGSQSLDPHLRLLGHTPGLLREAREDP